METEAKLGFKNKDDLYRVTSADFFRKFCIDENEPLPVLLENTYLDTRDMDITRRGGMIRVRHYSGKNTDSYEFTVKYGGGVSGGIHERYEWNLKSDDGVFSVEAFKKNVSFADDPEEMLLEAFGTLKDEDLKVLCSNSFNRTIYKLDYYGNIIEACFDSGIITDREGSVADEICELELELVNGDLKALNELTDLITGKTGGIPFGDTKYRRTLAAATGRQK